MRKIVGEYIVVPIGRMAKISPMMQITASTAWLWDIMKKEAFTEDSLVEAVLEHFSDVNEERARKDIQNFLKLLDQNYMLDNGRPEPIQGVTELRISPEEVRRLKEEENE